MLGTLEQLAARVGGRVVGDGSVARRRESSPSKMRATTP